jgi:hypothetical protein
LSKVVLRGLDSNILCPGFIDFYLEPCNFMRWVGHVAHMGERRGAGFWWGNVREGDHVEDLGVDGASY